MRNFPLGFAGFLLLALTLLPIQGWATEPYSPQAANPLSESWRWKHFPELEGRGVRNIAEGKGRRIWMGFNDGVYEYDGYAWKVHNAANGLAAAPVEKVFAASNGDIYAAAANGIFRYNGQVWAPALQLSEGLTIQFQEITEWSDGSLVFSSDQGAIRLLPGGKINMYTSETRVQNLQRYFSGVNWIRFPNEALEGGDFRDVSDVLEDRAGVAWFALTMPNESGRLLKCRLLSAGSSSITDYELIKSGPGYELGESQKLIQAMDNRVWVINSTYKVGITVFGPKHVEYIKLGDIFGGDEFMSDIVQSSDSTIWVGSLGKLHAYKNGKWEIYSAPHYAIPANRIMLQKSADNSLWVAGYKSKVLLLDYSTDRWLTYSGLNYQCELPNGEQWFIEASGKAVCHKKGSWVAYTEADGLIDAPIRIIATSKGQLWVAGSHRGGAATAVLKNGRWEKHLHPKLSWGIDYRAVFESRDGALWFGGSVDSEPDKGHLGGVLQLPNPQSEELHWIHHIYHENGLMQSNAYGIGQSPDGRIWLGGGSLYYYDGKQWGRPNDERLRQYVNVVHTYQHKLIVGSRYYGVFIYDGEDWKNYDTDDGLPCNTVISIDAISDSCLLVATENNISRFDGISWVSNIFPEELNMDFEGGNIFHDSQGAIWVNHSSRSWKRRAFSHSKNQKGAFRNFYTYRYIPDDIPPDTKVTLYSEKVSPEGNTVVEWEGNDFFAQSASQRLAYSYRLNGGKWSPFSTEQHHTFVKLKSGKYVLEVRARDLDFNIDPTPAVVAFAVQPPVWKQAWFILLMLAFLFTLGIYEYRVLSKKKKLEILNLSLSHANEKLKAKTQKIESQKEEILLQKEHILVQAHKLEASNKNLEEMNEEIRNQRDKLGEMVVRVEELSRAKLKFFTNISHELRTPLTLILGPAEQLRDEAARHTENERRNLYGIIQRNASRLLKLINQLLEIRRIEQSSLELNLQPLVLPDFIHNILGLFENLAVERDIELSFRHETNGSPVLLDPDKVEKIITNLVSNAFKHTPNGGKIGVCLSEATAAEAMVPDAGGSFLKLVVEDTGEGIPNEALEHIFDPYYYTAALSRKEFSSGIGLSFIKDLAIAQGGSIRAESIRGEGARFYIFFPLLEPDKEADIQLPPLSLPKLMDTLLEVQSLQASFTEQGVSPERRDTGPPPHKNGKAPQSRAKILIVEDNHDMLGFLYSILSANYELLTAGNGLEALEKAQEYDLDLILSDVMMPQMDGLEFCKLIKSSFATSHIPVILLTAKIMDDQKMAGYETGADDYITKPFNPELLQVRIQNLLKQRQQLRRKYNRDFILNPREIEVASPDEEMLLRLAEIMENHIDDSDFNVNKMCEMVHLSHMHFIRKVKQLTGKTPSELLKSFRMKRAKDLLAQKKITISEVAYQVGYDLPNSFSRVFRQEFGMTPTEFVEGLEA
ncbi:MAG: response regulator [Lewinellaceae bacterium]|nr:response regulator [Lewinellaceae bacterium]